MNQLLRWWRMVGAILAVTFVITAFVPGIAVAGTTGNITGTITDTSGKPVADVKVTAAAPSQTQTTTSNASGFYSLVNLTPDTYTVSFQKEGLQPASVPGITVQQDFTATLNQRMQTEIKTIASVRAVGSSNLVKPNQGSDEYTIAGKQLTAATNPLGTHETLYQWLAITPGVTGTGFPAQPRVRGGQVTDLGYEFEGIPIQDRITGFFTTNLSNIGLSNVEVYTGGLPASGSTNGTGYFNSVLKTGTYPGFYTLAYQASTPETNNYLTFEYGGATQNKKFSYYIGFDGVNSQNQYDYGETTYPNVLLYGYNGPGPVRTRDWVSNFHYRPDQNNDIQFVLTNSLGEFDYNYLLNKSQGEPPSLALQPCPGAVANPNTATGGSGGTAPNGQSCPVGLYFSPLSSGTGNIWHHYGGIGKIQWNHNINDHSFFDLRFAENFNQYIFDQPLADPNIPSLENNPYFNWAANLGEPGACPAYPYAVGSPLQTPVGDTSGNICAAVNGAEVFFGDRRSNMYLGSADYTNAVSANINVRAGISNEKDQNVFSYYLTNSFGSNGSWPNNYLRSDYPTSIATVWSDAQLRFGHLMVDPGLTYAQMHYGYPNGGKTQSIVNPVFNGTYTFDPYNALRFSYGNTSSFVGTGYVYRENSGTYNPANAGFAFAPQINHSSDLMFEHDFGDNTTIRVGPWYNKTTNYYESYSPVISTNPIVFGKAVLSNGQAHNALGAEFALNHVDNRLRSTSWWVSATYDNYWTTSSGSLPGSFVTFPLPQNLINRGVFVRAFDNPIFSGTILADMRMDRFHLAPLLYYQEGTFYNTGVISYAGPEPEISQNELIAGGYWKANLTAYEELGPSRNVIAGFTVSNLFNNTNDVAP
ncbi:MAG TPA: TonB-dependent receptor, partial [Candidatus Baltobacteraceae bacterium]|nr:TonB-dependent receptor [Candidatus Baltobacteraceae bacterium]